jgi:hypothetical protein
MSLMHMTTGAKQLVGRATTIGIVLFTMGTLLTYGVLFTTDFICRVLCFELNAFWNKSRAKAAVRHHASVDHPNVPPTIACVIGHREEYEVFERCMSSYRNHRWSGILLVCIDGTSDDDMKMFDVCEEVIPTLQWLIWYIADWSLGIRP